MEKLISIWKNFLTMSDFFILVFIEISRGKLSFYKYKKHSFEENLILNILYTKNIWFKLWNISKKSIMAGFLTSHLLNPLAIH